MLGIDHVVLRVRDLEGMVRWYGEVLGCEEERRLDELGLVQLRAGAQLIDLVGVDTPLGRLKGGPPDVPNMDHLCLRVARLDVGALSEALRAAGVDVGEAGVRYGADGFGPSLYLTDPEGNHLELKGPPSSDR